MQQSCLLITGMHRSGTSATAGLFTHLGFTTTKNVLSPHEIDNPKGYFEDAELVDLNNQILSSINSNWHDITLDINKIKLFQNELMAYRDHLIDIIHKNYSQYENFIIKDPRICHLLPLYLSSLQTLNINTKAIITYRDPVNIAYSLQKRDGFSIEKGITLWFNYFFAAEANTRKIQRAFLNYDQLLESPYDSIAKVEKYLKLKQLSQKFNDKNEEITEFLDKTLRHNYSEETCNTDYLPYYKELDFNKYNLNKLSFTKFSEIKERYNKVRDLFYYSEVTNMLNNYEELLTAKFFSLEVIRNLHEQIAQRDAQLHERDEQIHIITSSQTWHIALFLGKLRMTILPKGSSREKLAKEIYLSLRTLYKEGIIALWLKTKKHLGLSPSDYKQWILNNEPHKGRLVEQSTKAKSLKYRPLISIITPVWNTPPKILEQTIKSVANQTYDKWELCMADGNSNPKTKKLLATWAKKESRIKIVFLDENKGISENTNKAVYLAQGKFLAFLDHDDLLAPFALYEIAKVLQDNTDVDMIYTDEDKISKIGQRFDYFFKPDFSPDYLRSVNYMTHFMVIRKSLGEETGWLRNGYEGAQDYDLILRSVEKARTIVHIPKILYHWRVSADSTAGGAEAKPYANLSGKKSLKEHLERIALPAKVENGSAPTLYRVNYQHNHTPLVSIIIPNQDHADDLELCVNSVLEKTSYSNYEIILIENGSKEEKTFNLYEEFKQNTKIRIIEWNQPFNYSLVNNWGVEKARGEVVLFLNNDIQVINENWLEEMIQFVLRTDIGAVGAKLYYPDGTIQHGGVILGLGGVAGHAHKYFPQNHPGYFGQLVLPHNVSAITAACLMVRKQVFQEVNGFDKNYPLAFGDVDLSLKIQKKGYLNVWTPYAELYHHESKTRGLEETPEQIKRFKGEEVYFKEKWKKTLKKGDPYYNRNLTLNHEDFSIALE